MWWVGCRCGPIGVRHMSGILWSMSHLLPFVLWWSWLLMSNLLQTQLMPRGLCFCCSSYSALPLPPLRTSPVFYSKIIQMHRIWQWYDICWLALFYRLFPMYSVLFLLLVVSILHYSGYSGYSPLFVLAMGFLTFLVEKLISIPKIMMKYLMLLM